MNKRRRLDNDRGALAWNVGLLLIGVYDTPLVWAGLIPLSIGSAIYIWGLSLREH